MTTTRSATKPTQPPRKSPCNPTKPTVTAPTSSSKTKNPTNRSPIANESKKRRLDKGKRALIISDDEVDEYQEVVASDGVKRTLFKRAMPNATASGLDALRLTKEERAIHHRVFGYNIHGGRSYSLSWIGKYPSLSFFSDFLKFQGWEEVCCFSGPIYPIEIIQFFASVSVENGLLIAVVNDTKIDISVDDFCSLFSIPDDGIEINPSAEWGDLSEEEKVEIKNYFDVEGNRMLTSNLSPKIKFFVNFLWNTVVPRRAGREKLLTYEMIIIFHWLEGKKVNLPLLVFQRICQIAVLVTEEKFYSTIDLPYGRWLSRILESKGVVARTSYGIDFADEMGDNHLKYMKVNPDGPELSFLARGTGEGKGEIKTEGLESVVVTGLEKKLDDFMSSVDSKLEAQTKMLVDLITGLDYRRGDNDGVASSNNAMVARMKALEAMVRNASKVSTNTMQETFRQTDLTRNLASQGGGILRLGREMREEVGLVLEATKALSMKVLNFERMLEAQANHVQSCFDRLDSLEYRLNPHHTNPYNPPPRR